LHELALAKVKDLPKNAELTDPADVLARIQELIH